MSVRKTQRIPKPVPSEHLPVIDPHAAAVNVGSAEHWVAVPPGADPQPVRRFGAYTADLIALADWLKACGVTGVAPGSTGVYWIPCSSRSRLAASPSASSIPARPAA